MLKSNTQYGVGPYCCIPNLKSAQFTFPRTHGLTLLKKFSTPTFCTDEHHLIVFRNSQFICKSSKLYILPLR